MQSAIFLCSTSYQTGVEYGCLFFHCVGPERSIGETITAPHLCVMDNIDYRNVHVGRLIKQVVKERGMTVREFAEKLYCDRKNVYKIFTKDHISTGLLWDVSRVLDFDFYSYLSSCLHYGEGLQKGDKFSGKMNIISFLVKN